MPLAIGAVNKDKNTFSFHHYWNEAQLLIIYMVYTSCLMTY